MCLSLEFFKRKLLGRDYSRYFECSCDMCDRSFTNMKDLIAHTGFHETEDINLRLSNFMGIVRCNRCFRSFQTVYDMADHPCATKKEIIKGLTPVNSVDSMESVLIHDTCNV